MPAYTSGANSKWPFASQPPDGSNYVASCGRRRAEQRHQTVLYPDRCERRRAKARNPAVRRLRCPVFTQGFHHYGRNRDKGLPAAGESEERRTTGGHGSDGVHGCSRSCREPTGGGDLLLLGTFGCGGSAAWRRTSGV